MLKINNDGIVVALRKEKESALVYEVYETKNRFIVVKELVNMKKVY